MKRTVLFCLLSLSAHAQVLNAGKIADAIYRAEGGAQARVPYGILAVSVRNAAEARHTSA